MEFARLESCPYIANGLVFVVYYGLNHDSMIHELAIPRLKQPSCCRYCARGYEWIHVLVKLLKEEPWHCTVMDARVAP